MIKLSEANSSKYKKIEKYLNKFEFKKIKIGSLLAQSLEYRYYHPEKKDFISDFFKIIKYSVEMISVSQPEIPYKKFIFTKLIKRFHFDELIDPLILAYIDNSLIVCDPHNSFDYNLLKRYPIQENSVKFSFSISNKRGDTKKILSTLLIITYNLIKVRRRIKLSINEISFLIKELVIQLRSVSFWNNYFQNSPFKQYVITEFDRNNISSALILCARKFNNITITLTHGVITDYGFTPILADYIFCWGKLQKSQLAAQGISTDRIFITGNPMIKKIANGSFLDKEKITVCLAISPESEITNRKMINIFTHVLKNLDNIKGLIKLHPSLRKEDYSWVRKITTEVKLIESSDLTNSQLFQSINLLIIRQSGIANEALAAGVPVIILEPDTNSSFNVVQQELIEFAGCRSARDEQDLISIIEIYRIDPDLFLNQTKLQCKDYLEKLFESTGEDSVKCMINKINGLVTAN